MVEILPILVGVFLTQLSPGPNLIAVASSSLGSGRAAGVTTALGVASAVLFWATLFAFGIGAFLEAFPESITLMRILGGSYLLYRG